MQPQNPVTGLMDTGHHPSSTRRCGAGRRSIFNLLAAACIILPTAAAYAAPATAPQSQSAAGITETPGDMTDVFAMTRHFFLRGYESNRHGALVLGSLRATRDPALAPYFLSVSRAKDPMLQLTGTLDANYVSKNAALLHIRHFFAIPLPSLLTPSLALLIQYGHITNSQLETVLKIGPQPSQRLLAAAALVTRKQFPPAVPELLKLLASVDPSVRYYAAMTLLETPDSAAIAQGLKVLHRLAVSHSPDLQHIKRALLARAAVKHIRPAEPWLAAIAADAKATSGTRRRATAAMLYMKMPGAGKQLEKLIADAHSTIGRIELGLLAIQYGRRISPASLRILLKTRSPLQRDIARVGLLAAYHKNPLPEILHLVHQGQPLFLNWVYAYCRRSTAPHRLRLLASLVRYATVVDGQHDVDYLRAAAAAKRLANTDTPAARKLLAGFLQSVNPGVVEAALAGMMESRHTGFGSLVAPDWPQLRKNHDHQIRQFADVVMARSGMSIAMPELRNIVLYNDRRTGGFRAVAGWYYVKLAGKSAALLHAVSAAKKPGT